MLTNRATTDTTPAGIGEAVAHATTGRLLLTHPFYRRWEAGELQPGELAAYASQYRHFEEALPDLLADVAGALRLDHSDEAAASVERNLADELGNPEPHLELFDGFLTEVADGAAVAVPASPGTVTLLETYRNLVAEGAVEGLAGLAAYETQAASIAASKADGLRRWYGVGESGTAFWDVHAVIDADHGDWTIEALASLDAGVVDVQRAARRAADAWWGFLDEREAESTAASACATA